MIKYNTLIKSDQIVEILNPIDYILSFSTSIDSRACKKGELFICLKGENFDGFSFIEEVIKKDCKIVAYTFEKSRTETIKDLANKNSDICFVGVKNSEKFLQDISNRHIKAWKKSSGSKRVIGITGSNGKTTVKNMLFHMLNTLRPSKVICTEGNFNNHIGVPLTLLRVTDAYQFAIIEMGSNNMGEISDLCNLAMPGSGIITNIGDAHLEFFKNRENIFKEKSSLFKYVSNNKTDQSLFIISGDDLYLDKLEDDSILKKFGINSKISTSIKDQSIKVNLEGREILLKNQNVTGDHNLNNLLTAFLFAYFIDSKKAKKLEAAFSSFTPTSNRSEWVLKDGLHFFLDAYNANPSSMKVSVKAFIDFCKNKGIPDDSTCLVLGDMNELGNQTQKSHEELGVYLRALKVANVIFVGKFASFYNQGFNNSGKIYESTADLVQHWEEIKEKHSHFFIKGSRTLQLESLLQIG